MLNAQLEIAQEWLLLIHLDSLGEAQPRVFFIKGILPPMSAVMDLDNELVSAQQLTEERGFDGGGAAFDGQDKAQAFFPSPTMRRGCIGKAGRLARAAAVAL